MPNKDASGELASARLDFPPTRRPRRRRTGAAAIRSLEASVRRDADGVLLINLSTQPPSSGGTIAMPALAYLQFAGRIERAIAETLTNVAPSADR